MAVTDPRDYEFLSRSPAAAGGESTHKMDPTHIDLSSGDTRVSPCILHRRFDDAVDIGKVLEEITYDEAMSHSRLVQTATGVREVSRQLQRRPIKRAVRNVVIVTKARDNELVTLTRELAEWLMTTPRYGSDLGVNVYVDSKLVNSKRFGAPELLAKNRRFERMLRYWTPELCRSTPEKFDLVLTLGGDGTVLFTSWLFQQIVPPVLSFSLGSLGFLTPYDFQGYRQHLNGIMGGLLSSIDLGLIPFDDVSPPKVAMRNATSREILSHYAISSRSSTGATSPAYTSSEIIPDAGMRVNLRMRFTCSVHRAVRGSRASSLSSSRRASTPSLDSSGTTAGSSTPSMAPSTIENEPVVSFEVLNEIVIDRGPSPYVSNLELFGDDQLLTVVQADGCIFSTPTGSTAYSLSAGGSLVHPSIPAILLTPICPHTLSFRPMLLNDTISLRVAVPRGSRAGAWCSFDGKMRMELHPGDYVNIRASRYPFATVVGDKESWIDSVSRTLRWNTREARQKSWKSSSTGRGRERRGESMASSADIPIEPVIHEQDEDEAYESEDESGQQQEGFDIDFDDDDPLSSGESASGSTTNSPAGT